MHPLANMVHEAWFSLASFVKLFVLGTGLRLPWTIQAALDPQQMAKHLEAGKPILGWQTASG